MTCLLYTSHAASLPFDNVLVQLLVADEDLNHLAAAAAVQSVFHRAVYAGGDGFHDLVVVHNRTAAADGAHQFGTGLPGDEHLAGRGEAAGSKFRYGRYRNRKFWDIYTRDNVECFY